MGQVAFHAGISRHLFRTAYVWLGPLPAGSRWRRWGRARRSGDLRVGAGHGRDDRRGRASRDEAYGYSMELGSGAAAAGAAWGC